MIWDNQYKIDVSFIDEQHREWFERVAKLGRAIDRGESNAEMAKALKFVVEYTQKHFADEEAYMQEIKYARLESQRKLHKAFQKYIVDVLVNLKRGKEIPAVRLYRFMSDWIKQHIREEDQQIRAFLTDAGADDVVETGMNGGIDDPLAIMLGELGEMLASELITAADFESKKQDVIAQYAATPLARAKADAMAKLDQLKNYMDKGLLVEEDLRIGRQYLAESINLPKELALRDGYKDKMMHLKNLLGEEIISAEQYEAHKAEILDQMG